MKILRKELLTAMKVALPGLDTGLRILEGADVFVFASGHIYSFNDHISVAVPYAPAGKGLEGTVKAKEFYDLMNRLAGDEIDIVAADSEWKVKAGKATAILKLFGSGQHNRIQKQFEAITAEDYTWEKLPDNFMDALSFCVFGKNKSAISGVFVSKDAMVSTDEARLNWMDLTDPMIDFWITNEAGRELIKLGGVIEYGTGNTVEQSWIHFRTKGDVIFSARRLQQENYPFDRMRDLCVNHQRVETDISFVVPPGLVLAINRASSFSSVMGEDKPAVGITISKKGARVNSECFAGKYKEDVEWGQPVGEEVEPVSILIDYLMAENCMHESKVFYFRKISDSVRVVFEVPDGIIILTTLEKEEGK